MSEQQTQPRSLTGRVISDKMQKTVTVLIERQVQHSVYGKYLRRSTKLMAHDEAGSAKAGDLVRIVPCRPMSKKKAWQVAEVVAAAVQVEGS
ncbi:MAG: 30S ribosomal protein S17 [Xanthomonadales bacterium]|nr:30S ribosomal protein S17 [Xanthomonadales bacterium]